MFVIVHNNSVILGPMRWNRFRFENFLVEELEVSTTLPQQNSSVVTVSDEISIYPIQGSLDPVFNPKIEILHGPFWEFTDSAAISSYQVLSKTVESVKNELKSLAAAERWNRENTQVSVTINDISCDFKTDRETRMVLQNALTSPSDANVWKVAGDTWVTLTKVDLQNILTAVLTHVQASFDWEHDIVTQINAAETLIQLDSIQITQPNNMGVLNGN